MTIKINIDPILEGEPGNNGTIVVEAGHIYSNEVPAQHHILSAKIGHMLGEISKVIGYNVDNWLFVDNYNPPYFGKEEVLNLEDYIKILSATGFIPDKVVFEKDIAHLAKDSLDYLVDNNNAFYDEGKGIIYLGKGKINLYDLNNNHFFCAFLDACLYKKKAESSELMVTILPEEYKQEQSKALSILKYLGVEEKKVLPIYFQFPEETNCVLIEKTEMSKLEEEVGVKEISKKFAIKSMVNSFKQIDELSQYLKLEKSPILEVIKYVSC